MFFVWALALSGLFLIYLEFFLPGAIMAIGGSLLLIGSIFLFHIHKPGFLSLTLYLISLSAAVYSLVRFALWRVHSNATKNALPTFSKEMIGKPARTTTDLKPSGHITLDDQVYLALSETGAIDKGADVTIIGTQGTHLIVIPKEPS